MLINGLGMVKISDFSLVRELPEKIGLMTKNVVTRFLFNYIIHKSRN